jgi:DNA-binding PadR family transcriptional regulator
MNSMARAKAKTDEVSQTSPSLGTFGRYAGPATLILSSLADGAKHGYALTKDIEKFSGIRLAPGTLYEALSRLEGQKLIEAVPSDDRKRPYKLTAGGAAALSEHLNAQRQVVEVGLSRLAGSWGVA